jgi:hypothetical protein
MTSAEIRSGVGCDHQNIDRVWWWELAAYVMAAGNDVHLHESGLSMLVPPAPDDLGEAVHVACCNHLFRNRLQPIKDALEASICHSRTAKEKFNWCSVVPTSTSKQLAANPCSELFLIWSKCFPANGHDCPSGSMHFLVSCPSANVRPQPITRQDVGEFKSRCHFRGNRMWRRIGDSRRVPDRLDYWLDAVRRACRFWTTNSGARPAFPLKAADRR